MPAFLSQLQKIGEEEWDFMEVACLSSTPYLEKEEEKAPVVGTQPVAAEGQAWGLQSLGFNDLMADQVCLDILELVCLFIWRKESLHRVIRVWFLSDADADTPYGW